jgi:hypothetical protein
MVNDWCVENDRAVGADPHPANRTGKTAMEFVERGQIQEKMQRYAGPERHPRG